MIPLFSDEDFKMAKSTDLLKLQCKNCQCEFLRIKKRIKDTFNPNKPFEKLDFCSLKCHGKSQRTTLNCNCDQCGISFLKFPSQFNKTSNHFCSRRCSGIYFQKHKKSGNRRSKLEMYIEQKITILYPNLEVYYNKRNIIQAELDIYIPILNIAIELNGIFHYKPIYGIKKLESTKTNDNKKVEACLVHNIELYTIDISDQKIFTESDSDKYLEIIKAIVEQKSQSISTSTT